MSRLSRWLIAWVFWMGACAMELGGQTVAMDSGLAAVLQRVTYDSIEHAICLYGQTRQDTVYLSAFSIPRQRPLGTHNVSSNAEECWAAIGHFHNHPVPPDSVPIRYLYYSLSDEHAFIESENAAFALVGSPAGWCIWSRHQVYQGLRLNLVVLQPVPGQCVEWPRP